MKHMFGPINERTYGWMDKHMDGPSNVWTEVGTDGWMGG